MTLGLPIFSKLGDFTPQRVVSLQPSITSTFDRLGLLDRLVACTKYCAEVCPAVKEQRGVAIIEDSWTADSAQIRAAKPDLVIASVPYQVDAVAEILKSGAQFLGLAPRTLHDIYADIAANVVNLDPAVMFSGAYAEEPFVRLLDGERLPDTKHVAGTNFIDIAWKIDNRTNRIIVMSALDNIVKGASGQAVQCMNVMLGLPETAGLI